jgi:hypothetical protein
MSHTKHLRRRAVLAAMAAMAASGSLALPAWAQSKALLRISSPAVPDDWHARMWTVFKDALDKSAPDLDRAQVPAGHGPGVQLPDR